MVTTYKWMRSGRQSQGSVFLLAMVALITLMLLGTSLVESAVQGLAKASKDIRQQEAANLAESGVDMALCKLYEDYDSINETLSTDGTVSGSFALPQGTVSYTINSPYAGIADTCEVVSDATSRFNKRARVRVIASYRTDVGRVFEGAIFSNSPLTLNGSGEVKPDASGKGGSIYAKGDITFKGTSFTMHPEGFIYTTGTTNWVPPQVPATSVYQNIAPVPMPIIDLQWYHDHATVIYTAAKKSAVKFGAGGVSLSGLSGIIYVNGDVSISGQYTGKALIVATGDISITGNVTAGDRDTDAIALITTKSVKIAGNAEVDGLIYSHNVTQDASATINGTANIYGAVVADVVTTNGGVTVEYRDVWGGLPLPGKGKTQWAQFSWEEHDL
jgi:Tfp pilus assembly protein PilX/cytoskeletal protein CcmA (bactofilin family)